MACTPDFVQYVVDQSADAGVITAKKMFGGYCIYCDNKIFGLICDNRFYIKPTEAGRKLLRTEQLQPPYKGAKNYFYIEELDDHEYIAALVRSTCKELPEPKPKKRKKT